MDQVEAKRKLEKFRKEYDSALLEGVKGKYKSPQVVMATASALKSYEKGRNFVVVSGSMLDQIEGQIEYNEDLIGRLEADNRLLESVKRDLEAGEQI